MSPSNTILHLTPTSLYCIEIEKEATDLQIRRVDFTGEHCITYFIDGLGICKLYVPNSGFDLTILGLQTSATDITFDPSPYLERKILHVPDRGKALVFKHYTKDDDNFIHSEIDSLNSLLAFHGKHWTNPLIKPSMIDHDLWHTIQDWQHYEDNLIKGQLLFLTEQ